MTLTARQWAMLRQTKATPEGWYPAVGQRYRTAESLVKRGLARWDALGIRLTTLGETTAREEKKP